MEWFPDLMARPSLNTPGRGGDVIARNYVRELHLSVRGSPRSGVCRSCRGPFLLGAG